MRGQPLTPGSQGGVQLVERVRKVGPAKLLCRAATALRRSWRRLDGLWACVRLRAATRCWSLSRLADWRRLGSACSSGRNGARWQRREQVHARRAVTYRDREGVRTRGARAPREQRIERRRRWCGGRARLALGVGSCRIPSCAVFVHPQLQGVGGGLVRSLASRRGAVSLREAGAHRSSVSRACVSCLLPSSEMLLQVSNLRAARAYELSPSPSNSYCNLALSVYS